MYETLHFKLFKRKSVEECLNATCGFLYKFSTVLELLEAAFYGMDLLKLHSVTSKLLKRVDNVEKVSCNLFIYRGT